MTPLSRRRFISLGAGAGLAALGGRLLVGDGHLGGGRGPVAFASTARATASPVHRRSLVVLEMAGGNDALSMVVPVGDPAYRALRTRTAVDASAVHTVDGYCGLHPALRRIAARGPAIVPGVGVASPDLSHFEMRRRWAAGDPDGTAATTTGWLGRLCDVVGDPTVPAVGVTLGGAPAPVLEAERVRTVALDVGQGTAAPAPGDGAGLDRAWAAAVRAMAHPDRRDEAALGAARLASTQALAFADVLSHLPPAGSGYPSGDTGSQLQLAVQLLAADRGVRVLHVPLTGDFDVHTGALDRVTTLLADLDAGVGAMLDDLDARGMGGDVLVATMSEFGRRAADNGSGGLDHGTAAAMLLLGPVVPGVHGEHPHLDRLDADGNLVATTSMADHLATMCDSWLGAPTSEVLLSPAARPVAGILR